MDYDSIQVDVDAIKVAVEQDIPITVVYDNGCAYVMFNDEQIEICGNDLVYAFAYLIGAEEFMGA